MVHFAAESHVDRSIDGAGPFVRTNVMGTQVLLDAAHRHGVGRFVHVSTDEVYGSISEELGGPRVAPRAELPLLRVESRLRRLALAHHRTHGLDVVVTRCTNNYGPYQFPEKVVPLFITNLIDGMVPLYGDGRNLRDWLHRPTTAGDHLVLHGGRAGRSSNIGGGTKLKISSPACCWTRLARAGTALSTWPTAKATTCATRWTTARSASSGYALSRCPLRRAWPPRSPGRQHRSWWEPLKERAAPATTTSWLVTGARGLLGQDVLAELSCRSGCHGDGHRRRHPARHHRPYGRPCGRHRSRAGRQLRRWTDVDGAERAEAAARHSRERRRRPPSRARLRGERLVVDISIARRSRRLPSAVPRRRTDGTRQRVRTEQAARGAGSRRTAAEYRLHPARIRPGSTARTVPTSWPPCSNWPAGARPWMWWPTSTVSHLVRRSPGSWRLGGAALAGR